MSKISITGHMIVKNEDQFAGFALRSVLPYLDKIFVYDTGSTDKTVEIIKKISSPKIVFEEKGIVNPAKLVELRREQIERTETNFFMLIDGDEIWPEKNIEKLIQALVMMPKEKIAVYCRTRNAVGDIYHYLPNAGEYKFEGRHGHFNMRVFRHISGLTVEGIYPLETYSYQRKSLNNWDEKLFIYR